MKNTILPTFDYELYLGPETGTVENCLIKPIEALLSVFDKYGAKGTFFVDCAYLYKLNELRQKHTSLQQDYDMVSENLKMLAANGHEIQMHFHPQWLYSDYANGKWKLDFEHYKLSDVEPALLNKAFGESRMLLENLMGGVFVHIEQVAIA